MLFVVFILSFNAERDGYRLFAGFTRSHLGFDVLTYILCTFVERHTIGIDYAQLREPLETGRPRRT